MYFNNKIKKSIPYKFKLNYLHKPIDDFQFPTLHNQISPSMRGNSIREILCHVSLVTVVHKNIFKGRKGIEIYCSLKGTVLAMEFPGQEYWSGLPCPPPGDLPDPGIFLIQGSNLHLLHWQADSLPLSYWGNPGRGRPRFKSCLHSPPQQLIQLLRSLSSVQLGIIPVLFSPDLMMNN